MNEITEINPTQYGIEENKATELIGNLPQIQSERTELEKQFNEVIKLDIEAPETTIKARELRLLIQKNRTKGINVWHKTTKDFFLKGGQFVDAIKRREVVVNERMENDLEQIEKHAEIIENKRLEALQIERVEMISKFVEDADERDLSSMDCDVWEAYYQTKQKAYNDRILEERNVELQRKEAERKRNLHNERKDSILHLWQFVLPELQNINFSEIEDFESFVDELKDAKEKHDHDQECIQKENDRLQKEAEEKELQRLEEEKAREENQRLEREKHDAELEAERKEKQRLEDEINKKAAEEQKAIEEAEALKQSELNKGDAAKVEDLISDLEALKTKYSFRSAKNKKMYNTVGLLVDKIINHVEVN